MRGAAVCTAMAAGCVFAGTCAGGSFSDGTFANGDWVSVFSAAYGNGGSFTALPAAGGNPGASYEVSHVLANAPAGEDSGIGVSHIRPAFVYDFAASGAAGSIFFSIDVDQLDQSQRLRFALIQNGTLYVSVPSTTTGPLPDPWGTFAIELTAEDFAERFFDLTLDLDSHPEFGPTASPITLGFETSNSTGVGFGGYTTANRFDNYSAIVTSVATCDGDVNRDGVVDSDDLSLVLGGFGCAGGGCPGDADGNGATDSDDLSLVLGLFGESCE